MPDRRGQRPFVEIIELAADRNAVREDALARFDRRLMAQRYVAAYKRVMAGKRWGE